MRNKKKGRVVLPARREAEAMRAPLWPDKQMLYLAPMAKNCRFPAAAIVSVTAARRPREDKLPIQVRASSEEGKRGRRNPIPLLSFLPFLPFLST